MLGRHIFGYLPVNLVQGLVAFGTIAVFTRLLDPDAYGRYAMVLAAVQLAQGGCFYWLHAGAGRFYESAVRDGRSAEHAATGYAAFGATAAGVAAAALALLAVVPLPAALSAAMLAGLAALLLRSLLMIALENQRAARRVARFSALETVQSVLGLALGAALILTTGLGAAAPLLGLALASLACLALDWRTLADLFRRFVPRRRELRRFAAYGLPLSASLLMELALATSDRFLIGWFLGDAAVGVYAVGYALADRTLSILFAWVTMAAVPLTFAALERDGVEAARRMSARNAESLLFIVLPAAAGLALVAEPIAAVMVGAEFRAEAAAIIPWMALAGLLRGITLHYLHHAFLFSRRTDMLIWLMAIPMALNLGLNLVLIPRFGLDGAIASTVLAYAAAFVLSAVVGRRLFPLPLPVAPALKGLAAVAAMAVAVVSVPELPGVPGLVLPIATGVLAYGAAALALDLLACRRWLRGAARRLAF